MQVDHTLDQELQIRAEGWAITIRRLDLKDLDSAMSRPRTFFIGLHPQMHRTTQQEELLGLPYSSHYNLKLADFLDKKACPSDFEGLTVKQQQNVLQSLTSSIKFSTPISTRIPHLELWMQAEIPISPLGHLSPLILWQL